jgi:polyvinyl alcohol dehydrogenase (cytochrome)
MAQLAAQDVPRLKLKWVFGFPGANFALAQPTVMSGRIFIGSQIGKVYSLDAHTGCTFWEFDAGAAVRTAITVGQSATGLDGHLRAYSADDGRIVWDVDTKGEYRTVNGVAARGGSMDGPGPVVVGGTLYINSGYGLWGGAPGNVLLAYSVDGR